MSTKSYAARTETHPTLIGRKLLRIMAEKKTNLCVSIDVTDPAEVLSIVEKLAPQICLVKTHIDILTFDSNSPHNSITEFTSALSALSKKHSFLIFEDRKFADIGNTVSHQYGGGLYKIASWSHITNAHSLPGEGIIQGLQKVANSLSRSNNSEEDTSRGLLLLEEMSSAGNLFNSTGYRQETLEMARRNKNFVMGFIAMGKVDTKDDEDWIVMTPGVNIESKGDALGQQYKTPEVVIGDKGSDLIIVGRGIYGNKDMVAVAEEYRRRGWEAYERRIKA